MSFNKELAVKRVVEIVKRNYELSKKLTDINIDKKIGNDIVSDVDLFMEKNIIADLSKFYPSYSFYAEESGETKNDENGDFYEWIIDPIDGTVQFAAGLSDFGIVVALQKNGETILGVTYLPKLEEMYTCIKGKGAYCNGQKLRVSTTNCLNDSVIFVYLSAKHKDQDIMKTTKLIEKLAPLVRGVRIVGSSSCVSSWVASGKIDAIINLRSTEGLGSTAGRLFIKEAGGNVTNIYGEQQHKKDTMLCSNGVLHDKILNILSQI